MRELTYPKRHVSTKRPSLDPLREASRVRRQSLAHPSQTRLAGAAQPVGYIEVSRFSVGHQFRRGREGGVGTNCVLRRQKPTLLIESAMTWSSAASRPSRLRMPPSAARSLSTAASVTSSFVCDDSISEMSVENRLFCPRQKRKKERDDGRRYGALRRNSGSVEKLGTKTNDTRRAPVGRSPST